LLLGLVNLYGVYTLHGAVSAAPAAIAPAAPAPAAAPTPTAAVPVAPPAPVAVSADDDPVLGDADAPIEIIEFSDFECPFCSRFYTQTMPQIVSEYIDTGKAKLVFRDFPLSFHANAQKAHEAAECAKDQDKYWEMHDTIFENQQAISVADLKGHAADLGLDSEAFDSCLDSGEKAAEVAKDLADGQAAGASGTPTFFINGVKLVGAQPFSAFKQTIDAQLS
jgi:protein-disulfide isomerase